MSPLLARFLGGPLDGRLQTFDADPGPRIIVPMIELSEAAPMSEDDVALVRNPAGELGAPPLQSAAYHYTLKARDPEAADVLVYELASVQRPPT